MGGNGLTELSTFGTVDISIHRTRNMAKFVYMVALLLIISLCQASTNDDDSGDSDDSQSKESQTTEGKAGEAIKTLLQEKITQKFKEAANEVKGVLVKQLGDSLKSAHDAFNPPKDLKKVVTATKAAGDSKGSGTYRLKTGRKMHGHDNQGEPYEGDAQTQGTEHYSH